MTEQQPSFNVKIDNYITSMLLHVLYRVRSISIKSIWINFIVTFSLRSVRNNKKKHCRKGNIFIDWYIIIPKKSKSLGQKSIHQNVVLIYNWCIMDLNTLFKNYHCIDFRPVYCFLLMKILQHELIKYHFSFKQILYVALVGHFIKVIIN